MHIRLNGVADLADWGVIEAQGADAPKFLHGQLTQDFMLLAPDQARLAAYCSPKGRVIASFVGLKRGEEQVLLLCRRDVLSTALKRLSMFVLRAKLKLRDASADYRVAGLLGDVASAALGSHGLAWQVESRGAASAIALPSGPQGVLRAFWLASAQTALPPGPALAVGLWNWAQVRSALAWVGPATSEAFVPQMLNYESLGGVNFKKGCYPGQEVVARSQFRGTLKRRAHLMRATVAMDEGAQVFHSGDAEQSCGMVVMSAAAPDGGHEAIVSLQIAALDSGSLHLGSADGPLLVPLPLPYALADDV